MFEKNDELIKLDINEVNFDNCAEMFNNTNCSIIYITKNEKMDEDLPDGSSICYVISRLQYKG